MGLGKKIGAKPVKKITWPVRMSETMRDALNLMAADEDVTTVDLIRYAIRKLPRYKHFEKLAEEADGTS